VAILGGTGLRLWQPSRRGDGSDALEILALAGEIDYPFAVMMRLLDSNIKTNRPLSQKSKANKPERLIERPT
jgi:hypothetical protein